MRNEFDRYHSYPETIDRPDFGDSLSSTEDNQGHDASCDQIERSRQSRQEAKDQNRISQILAELRLTW